MRNQPPIATTNMSGRFGCLIYTSYSTDQVVKKCVIEYELRKKNIYKNDHLVAYDSYFVKYELRKKNVRK